MKKMQKYGVLLAAMMVLAACNNNPAKPAQETAASHAPTQSSASEVVEVASAVDAVASAVATNDGHNAENALDWMGTYRGDFPCADCETVDTTLILNQDLTYKLISDHKGGKEPMSFTKEGSFEWDKDGSIIKLQGEGYVSRFLVAEGRVEMLELDKDTPDPDGMYVLKKQP